MPREKERFLPRHIGRFNYWEFFRPGGISVVAPTKLLNKRQFELILTASPEDWNKEVSPWLHKSLSDIPDRRFFALEGYVLDDKGWEEDKDAQAVLKQLTPRQQVRIKKLSRETWHYQSQWTWDTLLQTIARDQTLFAQFCESPPRSVDDLKGTEHRIYKTYSKQAIKLLGGGSYIPPHRRKRYRDPLDGSPLLDQRNRLPSKTVFSIHWDKCTTRAERQSAKLLSLHWFHHALRNMKEYRDRRPDVMWTPDCAKTCSRIQQRLCSQ